MDRYDKIWVKIKKLLDIEEEYDKNCMKIIFNSDDDLPLNILMKFHFIVLTIRSVFEKDDKLYPQVVLNNCFYEV